MLAPQRVPVVKYSKDNSVGREYGQNGTDLVCLLKVWVLAAETFNTSSIPQQVEVAVGVFTSNTSEGTALQPHVLTWSVELLRGV